MAESYSNIKTITKDQFEKLYQISQYLNAAEYPNDLIEQTLDLVVQVIQAERAVFVRHEADSDEFFIVAARSIEKESITDLTSFSSGILQKVRKTKKACLLHDVQSDPKVSQYESVQIHQIQSVIGVPVLFESNVWGVILADSRSQRKNFTEENLLFLEFVASLFALALERVSQIEHLQNENIALREQVSSVQLVPEMVGQSDAMKNFFSLLDKVAQSDATVLLLGESGTGKDLAARAVHRLSKRKDAPYLAQFCGSIPDSLLESELFGYKKGAFTGANRDKKGLFEVASGGTFFLDEIADISIALQAKLLRVIQNKEIIRLGETAVKKVDVRIIAATNRDLNELVKNGAFRQDLFYRLNVFPITIPPLRARKGDIALLARHFLQELSPVEIKIDKGAIKKMSKYNWPGNVRQLENVIQRAVILCENNRIEAQHIIIEEDQQGLNLADGTLQEIEKAILLKRLEKFEGNRTKTAESLNVSVRWIQLKLKELNQGSS